MTIAAIIAEYNPFHNGHEYMIQKIKKELNVDYVIAVMSGNFTQRGIPGISDKFSRAKMAVLCGIDAVLELPVRFATSSAQDFAGGAVSILDGLGCIDYLAFGSENGTLENFSQLLSLMETAPESFGETIRAFQKQGYSYPKAISLAVTGEASSLLSAPNNVLGLEYMKALQSVNSSIRPYTVLRTGTGYHDLHTVFSKEADSMIASASAIRAMLSSTTGTIANAQPSMPEAAYRIFAECYGLNAPIVLDDFSPLLSYQLAKETNETLVNYLDISEDLANRLLKQQEEYLTFTERITACKHKQYTYARINRALLHILLGLRQNKKEPKEAQLYARLLALKKTSSPLMKEIKKKTAIPVITKAADAKKLLSPAAKELFLEDVFAANLYSRTAADKFHSSYVDDIRHGMELV